MTFMWPQMLWLSSIVPVLIALYVYFMRRRRKLAVRYASFAMLKDAMGTTQRVRRHVPPVLFLLAIVAMIVAIARPAAVITIPSHHETVVLAIDVSGSMRATDVEPNRLAAAQAAARTFVEEQPRSTRIAVVAFAATALVVQHPTPNREEVLAAIDRLQLQRGTAIGSGIVVSLATILPNAGITLESVGGDAASKRASLRIQSIDETKPGKEPFKPVPAGSYASAAVILLTDGQRTTGPDPVLAARLAADRGIRIFTVGIGTPDGEIMGFEGWRMRVRLDEETLKTVSSMTRGQYFYAGNATELKKVYRGLNSRFVLEKKETEITALFAGLAALLAVASATLSLLWFNRIL
ncbi:MAG TPA: VWA domain-containing protein [Burkholderiales bacterium]|nr:VWA domain-containing protein [Burkholderiales bacterium]